MKNRRVAALTCLGAHTSGIRIRIIATVLTCSVFLCVVLAIGLHVQ